MTDRSTVETVAIIGAGIGGLYLAGELGNLYTDASGQSHFRDIEVEWIEKRRGSKLMGLKALNKKPTDSTEPACHILELLGPRGFFTLSKRRDSGCDGRGHGERRRRHGGYRRIAAIGAGLDHRLGQFLDKERHPVGALDDLVDNIRRVRAYGAGELERQFSLIKHHSELTNLRKAK